jgi:hypothetical protein
MPQIRSDDTHTTITYDNATEVPDWVRELDANKRAAVLMPVAELVMQLLQYAKSTQLAEAICRTLEKGLHQIDQSNQHMINKVTGVDGQLAKANSALMAPAMTKLDSHVTENTTALRALQTQVQALQTEVKGQQREQAIIDISTLSGDPFEAEIAVRCGDWAKANRAAAERKGPDDTAGDVVITLAKPLADVNLVIVVEAKNDGEEVAHTPIRRKLAEAVANRKAQAAVYVCGKREGLAQEIRGFGEGTCPGGQPYIATTAPLLPVALSVLLSQYRLATERASLAITGVAAIETQLKRLTTLAQKWSHHSRLAGEGIQCFEEMRTIGCDIREEMRDCISEIQRLLRSEPGSSEAAG